MYNCHIKRYYLINRCPNRFTSLLLTWSWWIIRRWFFLVRSRAKIVSVETVFALVSVITRHVFAHISRAIGDGASTRKNLENALHDASALSVASSLFELRTNTFRARPHLRGNDLWILVADLTRIRAVHKFEICILVNANKQDVINRKPSICCVILIRNGKHNDFFICWNKDLNK